MTAGKRSQWGWHCLTADWAEEVVASAGPVKGKLVLDVGAGTGAITRPLARMGAKVIAVELHPQRVAVLRSQFPPSSVTVVKADARDLRLPRKPFYVVANPPFSVTAPLLNRLLSNGSQLQAAHIVLQLGAARRWADGDVHGASKWLAYYDVRIAQRLPRKAFMPRPHVDIAVLSIRRRA